MHGIGDHLGSRGFAPVYERTPALFHLQREARTHLVDQLVQVHPDEVQLVVTALELGHLQDPVDLLVHAIVFLADHPVVA